MQSEGLIKWPSAVEGIRTDRDYYYYGFFPFLLKDYMGRLMVQ